MKKDSAYELVRYEENGFPFLYRTAKKWEPQYTEALSELRWHEQLEIKLMLSGCAEITCGSDVFIAEAGDVVVINPYERHSTRPFGAEPPVYHLLMTQSMPELPGEAGELITSVLQAKTRFLNHICGNAALADIILRLFDEIEDPRPARELFILGYYLQMFAELGRNCLDLSPRARPAQKNDGGKIEPALALIAARYRDALSLSELAASCSVSEYHFCRLFKSQTGVTPFTYLAEYRVNRAALLLRATDLPVAQIASSVGLPDVCYFDRCFRRIRGETPGEYRAKTKMSNIIQ